MTIRTALLQGQQLLEEARISAPRLTAEVLLAHATQHERAWLYAHGNDELIELWWIQYGRYLHERLNGKPTQYITAKQEFYGREFRVTPDVLIPRPETEHVIEAALPLKAQSILDIGTGSGAIAITLVLETGAQVTATDVSERALRIAAANAHGLGANVNFIACDLANALSGCFDVIVSNPPYVPASDKSTIQREVRDYEPEVALYGGDDGLAIYRRLIPQAERLLNPNGWLILEIGYAAAEPVQSMLGSWKNVEIRTDLAGLPRIAIGQRR